ncbi:hypothetical protein B0H14DRAFT_2446187 [Mycena olivaceomarginata]|nr:hypothetical protein B0H14DRAFT_2446187 [Mycena olivaceomarginata]
MVSRRILTFEEEHLHYNCPICQEIFGHPYILNCGHSFCALCILRHIFSNLHACGLWHESPGCPLCRAPIFISLLQSPLILFTQNHVLASTCFEIVGTLRSVCAKVGPRSGAAYRICDEWTRKKEEGEREMHYLTVIWKNGMSSHDCLMMKHRLNSLYNLHTRVN